MSEKIKIKFATKNSFDIEHLKNLPNKYPEHEYYFDKDTKEYDWYVVYDDLPRKESEKLPINYEHLSCPQQNTILITYEPSSIKFYGQDYIEQFGHVLTSHEPNNLKHPSRYNVPPVGRWYYGPTDRIDHKPSPSQKTGLISTFSSAKSMQHTLHALRGDFIDQIKTFVPEVTYYGKGHKWVDYKYHAIDPYYYHIALENHIGPYHWTEKLSDSFLGLSLPFYGGCTNLEDYFPKESFIPIDVRDVEGSAAIIRQAIADDEYKKRLPALIEARRRVIEDFNLANYIGDCINENHKAPAKPPATGNGTILSRHLMMQKSPLIFARYAIKKSLNFFQNKRKIKQYCRQKT